MSKRNLQFSLRSLLIVTTVLAVLTALVANHLRVLIGIAIAIMWLLELAFFLYPFAEPFNDLRRTKTTGQVKRERMSEAAQKHSGRSV
jgi:hypothetical protein